MEIRTAADRGHVDHGWLESAHSFSFGSYYDPARMGFGVLRVINDDRIAPGAGFPTHPHRDMEIVTYVVEGALAHRDTLGNGAEVRPGEVQRMSAGTGVAHSEFNASDSDSLRLLQIWILPDRPGRQPGYEQKAFPADPEHPLRLVVSPDGAEGSVQIGQDVRLYRLQLQQPGRTLEHALPAGRSAWLQVVRGELTVQGETLTEGDAAALPEGGTLQLSGASAAEALLFDLPEVGHA